MIKQSWLKLIDFCVQKGLISEKLYMHHATEKDILYLLENYPIIPKELVGFLLTNNGINQEYYYMSAILGFELLSVKDIIRNTTDQKMIIESMEEDGNNEIEGFVYPQKATSRKFIDPYYISFANDFRGSSLVVDVNPDRPDCIGQVTHTGHEDKDRYVISKSLDGLFGLALTINQDERMETEIDNSGRKVMFWRGEDGSKISSLLDLLPILYKEGRLD